MFIQLEVSQPQLASGVSALDDNFIQFTITASLEVLRSSRGNDTRPAAGTMLIAIETERRGVELKNPSFCSLSLGSTIR